MILSFSIFWACSDSPPEQKNTTTPQQRQNSVQRPPHPPKGKGSFPPPKGMLPGGSPAEDLKSSWKASFANSSVPTSEVASSCPDKDKDGFVDATSCPHNPPSTLDCDDNDPAVTPKTEIWIPPGPFIMGSTSSHAGSDEKPVHVVTLSGYCLDTHEVAAQDWFDQLKKTGATPQGSDVRNLKNGQFNPSRADYPAEGVTYSEAKSYCEAQGKSLPTEAQWEKAARGGCELGSNPQKCDLEDLRPYPWGKDAPTCAHANHQLSTKGMPKLCVSDTLKVDSLPKGAGPYGHLHLSGNVWEYVLDAWHPQTYTQDRPIDPAGPKQGDIHVLRGGGWNTFSTNMRNANRFHDLVMGSASGFRCARGGSLNYDSVSPLEMVALQGSIYGAPMIKGRALYVTAFDAADADPNGMLVPGRSPVAEIRLIPNGKKEQSFSLEVPKSRKYILSAALDAGTGAQKDDYISASGSGGFGHAKQNPISAPNDQNNISMGKKYHGGNNDRQKTSSKIAKDGMSMDNFVQKIKNKDGKKNERTSQPIIKGCRAAQALHQSQQHPIAPSIGLEHTKGSPKRKSDPLNGTYF